MRAGLRWGVAGAGLAAALAMSASAAGEVEERPLATLDLFTTGAADTGLGPTLWRGTSAQLARDVFAQLAAKPLSPAATALARRVLETGAPGPDGAGGDADLAGERALALVALGRARAVDAMLGHAPNVQASPLLARAGAEAALLVGKDDRACALSDGQLSDRAQPYWLRLRAYCQAIAGDADGAQITFALAKETAPDPVYGRMMSALIIGAARKAGAASYRNGLEVALSSRLNLAPSYPALNMAPLAVRAVLRFQVTTLGGTVGEIDPVDPPVVPPDAEAAAQPLIAGAEGGDRAAFDALFDQARAATGPRRPILQGRVLVLTALGQTLNSDQQGGLVGFDAGPGVAAAGALASLDAASEAGARGQTALIALSLCADAGPTALTLTDRARIVGALRRVGLAEDARNFALEAVAAP